MLGLVFYQFWSLDSSLFYMDVSFYRALLTMGKRLSFDKVQRAALRHASDIIEYIRQTAANQSCPECQSSLKRVII